MSRFILTCLRAGILCDDKKMKTEDTRDQRLKRSKMIRTSQYESRVCMSDCDIQMSPWYKRCQIVTSKRHLGMKDVRL